MWFVMPGKNYLKIKLCYLRIKFYRISIEESHKIYYNICEQDFEMI